MNLQDGLSEAKPISFAASYEEGGFRFALPTLRHRYLGARFAKIRCNVRRCMFRRRAVSETLRLHIS